MRRVRYRSHQAISATHTGANHGLGSVYVKLWQAESRQKLTIISGIGTNLAMKVES